MSGPDGETSDPDKERDGMSKKGGNKIKTAPKPTMANKGPKKK